MDFASLFYRIPAKRLLGYAVVFVVLGFAIFRASYQSIMHDEAVTYTLFAALGPQTLFLTFNSNNHTLLTFLMWLSTSVFGLSVLSVRLPALLGGALYLVMSERICHLAFKNTFYYIVTLLALATSPFVMDFLNMARGYSLALGFMMAALFFAFKQITSRLENAPYHEIILSISVAFSVSANLSFAFANAALLFSYFSLLTVKYFQKEFSARQLAARLFLLMAPGGLLYLVITPSILFYSPDTLYFGTGSWRRAFDTILTVLFDGYAPSLAPENWRPGIGMVAQYLPYGLVLFSIIAVFIYGPKFARYIRFGERLESSEHLWSLVVLTLLMIFVLLSAARFFFGVLLPRERTGIYLVPLLVFLTSLSIAALGKPGFLRVLERAGQFCVVLVLIYFGLCLRLDGPRELRSYYDTERTFRALASAVDQYPAATIGVNWRMEPGLNFYAKIDRLRGHDFPRFTRHTDYQKYQLLVLLPQEDDQDRKYLASHPVKLLYENPASGAVVVLNQP